MNIPKHFPPKSIKEAERLPFWQLFKKVFLVEHVREHKLTGDNMILDIEVIIAIHINQGRDDRTSQVSV